MSARAPEHAFVVQALQPEHVEGVIALAAEEPTAPHWPAAEYYRMLEVIADTPARRGAWVLLDPDRAQVSPAIPDIVRPQQDRSPSRRPKAKAANHGGVDQVPRQKVPPGISHRYGLSQLAGASQGASAKAAGAVVGFAMASQVVGICDLEAVVVHVRVRGQRLGELLVSSVAEWGELLGATRLNLEVRASNVAALRLYRRMGFTLDGTRPGYYCNPVEEAVLMSLRLSSFDQLA